MKDLSPLQLLLIICGVIGTLWASQFLLRGVGEMVSLIISGFKSSIATVAFATWAIPALSILSGTISLTIIVKKADDIKKEPYKWLVPILGICSGAVVSFCKDYLPTENEGFKIIFEAVVACLYIISGYLWEKPNAVQPKGKLLGKRSVAIFLFLTPPVFVYASYAKEHSEGLLSVPQNIPAEVIQPILWLLGIFIALIVAAWALKK